MRTQLRTTTTTKATTTTLTTTTQQPWLRHQQQPWLWQQLQQPWLRQQQQQHADEQKHALNCFEISDVVYEFLVNLV